MDNKEKDIREAPEKQPEKGLFDDLLSSIFSENEKGDAAKTAEPLGEPEPPESAEDAEAPEDSYKSKHPHGDIFEKKKTSDSDETLEYLEELEKDIPADLRGVIFPKIREAAMKALETDESFDPEDAFDYPDAPEDEEETVTLPKKLRQKHLAGEDIILDSGNEPSPEDGEIFPVDEREAIDLSVETSKYMPNLLKREVGLRGNFRFFLAIYALFLSLLVVVFYFGMRTVTGIYEEASPRRVADEYIRYISESKLFNDIAGRIKDTHTEFESELRAAESAMEKLSFSGEKSYYEVSRSENGILYDVFSEDTHVYSLTLRKKGEVSPFGIDLWEVNGADFVSESLASVARTYTFSAPKDAKIYINGKEVSRGYITDGDYRFFTGTVWESKVPESAKCVLYTVRSLYSEPEFKAYLDGEELETYRDEGSDSFHAKYPSAWVKDYTVEVPKGATVHVNGVLATVISGNGSAKDTLFDSGAKGITDIYKIEGLFEEPNIRVTYNDKSIGEPTVSGTSYVYGYTEEMYLKVKITVPVGTLVKVNGILLGEENSKSSTLPFEEWTAMQFGITSYKPSELKHTTAVKLPEFTVYEVSGLYSQPEISAVYEVYDCPELESKNDGEKNLLEKVYDYPQGILAEDVSAFAKKFAAVYMEYITEGCYGIRDDIELRKNFYNNWKNYLSYILPDSLAFDNALDSYTDVEYRPSHKLESESYEISDIRKYSEDIYILKITATTKDNEDPAPVVSVINAAVIRVGGEFKIWMHDELAA